MQFLLEEKANAEILRLHGACPGEGFAQNDMTYFLSSAVLSVCTGSLSAFQPLQRV